MHNFMERTCIRVPINEAYVGSNRCDVALHHNGNLIIIELKYKETVECAMKQIEDRNYLDIIGIKKVITDEYKIERRICLSLIHI